MENLENAIAQLKEELPGLTILENEPMSAHSSFRIGGPVRALAIPQNVTSLSRVSYILKQHHIAPFILGNGTNILFPDEGLADLFIISTEKLTKLHFLPDGAIYCEAGVSMARLAGFAAQNGLTGLEFASGIPGSVGGGIFMNAGAYDGEMKDCVESVVTYYIIEQQLYELTNAECRFGYRDSLFQHIPGNIILSVVLRLQKGDPAEINAKMKDLSERRRAKQPLEYPSAGSAFKRPEGHYAAALIDQCGLKGYTVGGAQVSEKHAGFVINRGGATSHDVYDLMMHVRNTVHDQTQVELVPEIMILAPDYKLEDHSPVTHGNYVTEVNRESVEDAGQGPDFDPNEDSGDMHDVEE